MTDQNPAPEGFASPVIETAEEVLEKITNTNTPAASAGVMIDWIIQMIEHHPNGASGAVQELKDNKESLAQAVAANP